MAASATGDTQIDHLRIMGLAEAAHDFAAQVLKPGGTFVAKVLRGGTERTLLDRLKRDFAKVRHVKPEASRAEFGGDVCRRDRLPPKVIMLIGPRVSRPARNVSEYWRLAVPARS